MRSPFVELSTCNNNKSLATDAMGMICGNKIVDELADKRISLNYMEHKVNMNAIMRLNDFARCCPQNRVVTPIVETKPVIKKLMKKSQQDHRTFTYSLMAFLIVAIMLMF